MFNYKEYVYNFKPNTKLCQTCAYKVKVGGSLACDYFSITGEMRNCDPCNCKKYKSGKRINVSNMTHFAHAIQFDDEDYENTYYNEYIKKKHKYKYNQDLDIVDDVGMYDYYDSYDRY